MMLRIYAVSILFAASLPALATAQDAADTEPAETESTAEPLEEGGTITPDVVDRAVEEAPVRGVEVAEEGAIEALQAQRERDSLLAEAGQTEMEYQLTLPRVWALNVPGPILDAFLARHSNTWEGGQTNFVYGTEFIFRQPGQSDTVIGLDYADIRTEDDYWLEDGDPVRDADWTINSLRLVTLDVAHHWLTDLTSTGDLQLYYGVGLGISVVLGEVLKYDVRQSCLNGQGASEDPDVLDQCIDADGNAQYDEASETREEKVWPILPALSLTVGTRYYISDHFVAGIELGWKSLYEYGGLEIGYLF